MEAKVDPHHIIAGGAELFPRVEPLWHQLRSHHADASPHFGDQLRGIDFASRREGLIRRASLGLLVLIASDSLQDLGYCVSLVDGERVGEIQSLFVVSKDRGRGVGHSLMREALSWFDSLGVQSRTLEVLVGNERALSFYERYGFRPRTYRLMQTPISTQTA